MAQHIVKRFCIVRAPPDFQIEQQAEHLAFIVIRDRRVHRVLVPAILLDPGVEARLFSTHLQTPWRCLNTLDLFGDMIEVLTVGGEPGASQHEVGIVFSNTFGDPQQTRIVLLGVIEWPERLWPDPFYVPYMKELVGHQAGKVAVPSVISKSETAKAERG